MQWTGRVLAVVVVTRVPEVVAIVLSLAGVRKAWPSHGKDVLLNVGWNVVLKLWYCKATYLIELLYGEICCESSYLLLQM
jgi:hypothetical protein